MNPWRRLWQNLGMQPPGKRLFALKKDLAEYIEYLAAEEKIPADTLLEELVEMGLEHQRQAEEAWQRWLQLSPREQQVAALVCLGYTNPQIASALVISVDTAKTHVKHIMRKFDVHSRGELRIQLADWDFSAWRR